MRFFYNGISYGPSVNKNQIYSGKQLVELMEEQWENLKNQKQQIKLERVIMM